MSADRKSSKNLPLIYEDERGSERAGISPRRRGGIAKIARIAKIAEIENQILPQIYADDRRSEKFKNSPLIHTDNTDRKRQIEKQKRWQ
jgi:hypothetical protein